MKLGETLAVPVTAALAVVEPLIEGVAVTAALADQDAEGLAARLVLGVKLDEAATLLLASTLLLAATLPVGLPLPVSEVENETLSVGVKLGVGLADSLDVRATLLLGEPELVALPEDVVDGDGEEESVTLTAATLAESEVLEELEELDDAVADDDAVDDGVSVVEGDVLAVGVAEGTQAVSKTEPAAPAAFTPAPTVAKPPHVADQDKLTKLEPPPPPEL